MPEGIPVIHKKRQNADEDKYNQFLFCCCPYPVRDRQVKFPYPHSLGTLVGVTSGASGPHSRTHTHAHTHTHTMSFHGPGKRGGGGAEPLIRHSYASGGVLFFKSQSSTAPGGGGGLCSAAWRKPQDTLMMQFARAAPSVILDSERFLECLLMSSGSLSWLDRPPPKISNPTASRPPPPPLYKLRKSPKLIQSLHLR